MTRQLTITAAEWASIRTEGDPATFSATGGRMVRTLWLVARGNEHWLMAPDEPKLISATPPVEFVQACAPCEMCGKARELPAIVGMRGPMPCPDCRIELVGPPCDKCSIYHRHTLGHAYAVGQPLLIVTPRGWVDSEGLVVVARPDGRCIVMNEDKVVGEGFSLAHYDLASLPGKWALRLEVVPS